MSKKQKRDLALITTELHVAMHREVADIIAIGGLLIEARQHLEHGEWLPWLEENFGSSARTATNYMAAAALAKSATISDLKLRPSALYMLGAASPGDDLYTPEAKAAIFQAAETRWISADQARDIAYEVRPPRPEVDDEEADRQFDEAAAARKAELDNILDGQPPELPSAPDTAPYDVIVPPFDAAVATLVHLQTKSLASFTTTTHRPDEIRAVVTFLKEVADALEAALT
jgi:hypothetical protein